MAKLLCFVLASIFNLRNHADAYFEEEREENGDDEVEQVKFK